MQTKDGRAHPRLGGGRRPRRLVRAAAGAGPPHGARAPCRARRPATRAPRPCTASRHGTFGAGRGDRSRIAPSGDPHAPHRRRSRGDPRQVTIGGAGLAALAGHPRLEALQLWYADDLDDEALAHLRELPALKELDLYYCGGFTDEGAAHLGQLFGLRSLVLSHTEITDAALTHLARLKHLTSLDLDDTAVTDAGLAALRATLPRCQIVR